VDATGPGGLPDGIITILVLGDSNTAGSPKWPTYLQDLFLQSEQQPPVTVLNRARAAMTAGDHGRLLPYGPAWVGAHVGEWLAQFHPDVVLVMLGTNDVGLSSPMEYLSDILDLMLMVNDFSSVTYTAVALVPPSGREQVFPSRYPDWNEKTQAFNDILLENIGGLVMDFHSLLTWPEDFADIIHIRTDTQPPLAPHYRLAVVAFTHLRRGASGNSADTAGTE
jgi:hypothetical protein